MHQGIGFAGDVLGEAPVHRQKHRTAADSIGHFHRCGDVATARADRGEFTIDQLELFGIAGVNL